MCTCVRTKPWLSDVERSLRGHALHPHIRLRGTNAQQHNTKTTDRLKLNTMPQPNMITHNITIKAHIRLGSQ